MIAQWTGDVIGKMHVAGVSMKQLADELGWNVKYLSSVINCRREPKDAEQKVRAALDALLAQDEPEASHD